MYQSTELADQSEEKAMNRWCRAFCLRTDFFLHEEVLRDAVHEEQTEIITFKKHLKHLTFKKLKAKF